MNSPTTSKETQIINTVYLGYEKLGSSVAGMQRFFMKWCLFFSELFVIGCTSASVSFFSLALQKVDLIFVSVAIATPAEYLAPSLFPFICVLENERCGRFSRVSLYFKCVCVCIHTYTQI